MNNATERVYLLHAETSGLRQLKLNFINNSGRQFSAFTPNKNKPFMFCQLDADFKSLNHSLLLADWYALDQVHLKGEPLFYGLYLNELLIRLAKMEELSESFIGVYAASLQLLSDETQRLGAVRYFEKRLLGDLGYGISLDVDHKGVPVQANQRYHYIAGAGLQQTIKNDSFTGSAIQAADCNDWSVPGSLSAARLIYSAEIDRLLDGKKLLSRDLIRHQYQRKSKGYTLND